MNKDEMVKDLKRDYKLCVTCEMFNGWVDESGNIHDAGCLEHLNCDCNATDALAKILINADYRKVGEDEIVIKKSEYKELKTHIEELQTKLGAVMLCIKNTHEIDISDLLREKEQETAREIFQELKQKYGRSCSEYYPEYIELTDWELNKIAQKYDIELR